MLNLEACLPAALRGHSTLITRIQAGLSGASIYRVEAAGETFILKVSNAEEPLVDWRQKLGTLQRAAEAGLAPRVLHAVETERAILSAFVVDRSFPAFYRDPQTHERALVQLGQMIRRVHALPLGAGQAPADPRALLVDIWGRLQASFSLPAFVAAAVEKLLAEQVPSSERALVLSHNDVNPTNLIYDGEKLLLLDWDTSAPNDPLYDLAAISVFLRMDDATCLKLLSAHDGAELARLPRGLVYQRRLVAVLCGSVFLNLARHSGHAGALGSETLDTTPGLGDVYQRMGSGGLKIASAEGQWALGLALLKTSSSL